MNVDKLAVHDFWQQQSCGEVYATGGSLSDQLITHARLRYELEPYIRSFARFEDGAGRDVLEIGVGMGADHVEWARHRPRRLVGVDLTERAVQFTCARMRLFAYKPCIYQADAEALPFPDNSFDLVYSWGVLHHSPDTPRAVGEVHRVLRPSGIARIMIYHTPSLVGYMLWARYGLLAGRPFVPLSEIYAKHLESPGTKAYTTAQARSMLERFSTVDLKVQLSFGDLLQGKVGQRHRGIVLRTAKIIWPRRLIRMLASGCGLMLQIEARK